jgi:nitroimidazol reductase NimA-like FMN-containing flavoprotein (pyridoxamine 5'-phosphate oxidase superfamily)
VATWAELAGDEPELAEAGERIFRAFTLAFLATIRGDGGPRVHPVTITVHDGRLYAFLVHGTPKRSDLLHDPRSALHSFPSFPSGTVDSYVDDEVVLFGAARPVENAETRAAVTAVHNDTVHERDLLFELDIDRAQHETRRDGEAVYTRWRDGTSEAVAT